MRLVIVTATGSKTTYQVENQDEAMGLLNQYAKEHRLCYNSHEVQEDESIQQGDSELIRTIALEKHWADSKNKVHKEYRGQAFIWSK